MSPNWLTKNLGEVISTIESGKRPKGGAVSSGIPSVGVEHISDSNGFKLDDLKYIPEDFYESLNKGKLNRGDILIAKDGATTGKTVFLSDDFPFSKAAANEHIFILRGKNEIVNQKFLFYILYSPQGQKQVLKTKHGAAQGGIDQSFVNFVKIPLPPLPTQQKIVERMDKIAEAQKLNDDLIQKAEELFQSLLHQELNPAGKDWEVKKLGELVEFLDHMRKPVNDEERQKRVGPYPYYGANGQVGWIDDYIFDEDLVLLAEDGGYFGSKDRPIAYRISGKTWVNNHAHVLRSKIDLANIDFIYFSLMFYDIMPYITGSTRAKLNKSSAERIKILLPPLKIQKQIVAKLSAAQDYKKKLLKQKELLQELFESTLDKAMKGELVR